MSSDEYVYGHVLEALSGGLYPNKLDVIREYLQNSYDEIVDCIKEASEKERERIKKESKVVVTAKSGSLFIFDNGKGMDFETLNEYRKIGYSRKRFGEHAGWRGIGKAAGLAVAEKLIVTTSRGQGKTFQLVFDSKEMIDEVSALRAKGENIPFSVLIGKYSQINTIDEGDQSFTQVELHKVKAEDSQLLDENRLIAHLSAIAPVPFNPIFKYAERIEAELANAVEDYIPINLFVGETQVFRPFLEEWTNEEETVRIDEPLFVSVYDESRENLIAFCWYCMHCDKGRIKIGVPISGVNVPVAGVSYRAHNIKIGDASLARKSLWRTTPERSHWAVGEIHVLDDRVEPTSDRNDFLDNHARLMLYEQARVIAQEISRRAGKLSEEMKAKEKINEADARITKISAEVASKKVPKPLVSTYMYEVMSIKEEAEKRKPKTPEKELKEKAESIVRRADAVVNQLTESLEPKTATSKVYSDIVEELKIGQEGKEIYNAVVATLQDYYANEPSTLEEIVRKLEKAIAEALAS
jgi:hypothetical protein